MQPFSHPGGGLFIIEGEEAMIRAVLFDLDETLIDRSLAIVAFAADQYRRCEAILAGIAPDRFESDFLEIEDGGRLPKKQVYPRLAERLGLAADAAGALLADYTAHYPSYATFRPEAKPAIDALAAMGMKLGIITNGEATVQYGKIDALGIREMMDVILVSSVEGISKPDPAIFQRAVQRLDLAEPACLFVGDNPKVDIVGAEAAGLAAAWLTAGTPWPDDVPPPRHVLATLSDLVRLVEG